jgi:hypothetical protein
MERVRGAMQKAMTSCSQSARFQDVLAQTRLAQRAELEGQTAST